MKKIIFPLFLCAMCMACTPHKNTNKLNDIDINSSKINTQEIQKAAHALLQTNKKSNAASYYYSMLQTLTNVQLNNINNQKLMIYFNGYQTQQDSMNCIRSVKDVNTATQELAQDPEATSEDLMRYKVAEWIFSMGNPEDICHSNLVISEKFLRENLKALQDMNVNLENITTYQFEFYSQKSTQEGHMECTKAVKEAHETLEILETKGFPMTIGTRYGIPISTFQMSSFTLCPKP